MDNESAGRWLVSQRKRIEATCAVCGEPFMTRLVGKERAPERRYCKPACRLKAYYQQNREKRLAYQRQKRRQPREEGQSGE